MCVLYESYAKSVEVKVTAQKIPTVSKIYLWDEGRTTRLENKTVYAGSKVRIEANIFTTGGKALVGKTLRIFHRVNTGAWEKIAEGATLPSPDAGYFYYTYTLAKAGNHTFYADFLGDAIYEGCKKTVRLSVR